VLTRVLQRADLANAGDPTDFSDDYAAPDERHFGVDIDIEARVGLLAMRRSIGWVIGSSLLFEGVVVGIAAWIFCRRDY
jgi:hypothetical protein